MLSHSWSSCEQVGPQPCQSSPNLRDLERFSSPLSCTEQVLPPVSHSRQLTCCPAFSSLPTAWILSTPEPSTSCLSFTLYNREGNPSPVDIIFSPGIYWRTRKAVTNSALHEKQEEKNQKADKTIEHTGQRTGPPQAHRPPDLQSLLYLTHIQPYKFQAGSSRALPVTQSSM